MNKNYILILIFALLTIFSCQRNVEESTGIWNSGPIEGVSVTPINGGATITYNLPNDENLLYVMAEYERNGKMFTEKASVYKNSLTIEGFDTRENVKAKLYKVNKQGQRSESAEIEFTPLESLVSIAKNSLKLQPGFGGIIAAWQNPFTTELGVRFMVKDEDGKWVNEPMYFTAVADERHSFRGFDPKPVDVAISFEDKWGNSSDTVYYSTTPLFETLIAKPYVDYRASIPYDNTSNLTNRTTATLWDNIVNTAAHGWLTAQGSSGLSITFDLKQVVKLSRIVIHGYHVNSPYTQVNIQQFEAWGTDKIDFAKLSNLPYWLDEFSVRAGAILSVNPTTELPAVTFKDDWQYLGWHKIPRYDLMVPPDNVAIANISANGTEYEMPIDAKPVRYVRIFVREVGNLMPPPSNNYFSMGEITFYGDNTVVVP